MKLQENIVTLLFLLFGFSAIAQQSVPSAAIKTLDGKTVDLQDYAKNGKITVFSLWATWCSPCKKELDAIAEIYPDWQEEYDMELVAITIDTQRALAKVKPMVEAKGWEYIVLSDANNVLRNSLQFQSIPQTYLVDQSGKIVYTHTGYVPGDEYELEDQMKKLKK